MNIAFTDKAPQRPFAELATLADLPQLKVMMDKANKLSVEQSGFRQWVTMDHVHGQMEAHIQAEEMYVVRGEAGRPVAAIALSEQDGMWAGMDDGTALYVHKLMKDPTAAIPTTNVGAQLLHLAAEHAFAKSKSVVRCDVKQQLPKLVGYYASFGFTTKCFAAYSTTRLVAHLMEVPAQELVTATAAKLTH